jgi:hypothetical protein
MGRIRNAGVNRADGSTLGLIVEANTLSALAGIDHVDLVALRDSFVGALGLASAAGNAVFRYHVGHFLFLLFLGNAPDAAGTTDRHPGDTMLAAGIIQLRPQTGK